MNHYSILDQVAGAIKQQLCDGRTQTDLAAVSSFLNFCTHHYALTDPATGREHPLARSNPARRPARKKVAPYGKATHLDLHQVRAMLRAGLTDDLREIQRFLNHTHLNTTQIYLQHAGRRADNLWMQVETLIGVD